MYRSVDGNYKSASNRRDLRFRHIADQPVHDLSALKEQ